MNFIKYILLFLILLVVCEESVMAYAKTSNDTCNITQLRAGGGGGGSGGGSGGRGGSFSSGRLHGRRWNFSCDHHIKIFCVFDYIGMILILFSISSIGAIVFYLKVIKSSINSKRYMKLISQKDITWKYKNIEKQVIDTFYVVQNAWTNMNMELAREYMDEELYESFRQKIEWMDIGNKRNVLKRIKLMNLKPVSVIDESDNSKDMIWFYIKGSMVDYIIDKRNNEIIDGKNTILGIPFIEYWKFVRKDNRWVLAKILQEYEKDKINFQ